MSLLFYIIIYLVLSVVDYVLGTQFLTLIFSLAVLVPSIAIGTRRLHDINRSGWWQLLYFIPIIGMIILIIWFVTDSDSGINQFGENPELITH